MESKLSRWVFVVPLWVCALVDAGLLVKVFARLTMPQALFSVSATGLCFAVSIAGTQNVLGTVSDQRFTWSLGMVSSSPRPPWSSLLRSRIFRVFRRDATEFDEFGAFCELLSAASSIIA
jgi:hypothetical protein